MPPAAQQRPVSLATPMATGTGSRARYRQRFAQAIGTRLDAVICTAAGTALRMPIGFAVRLVVHTAVGLVAGAAFLMAAPVRAQPVGDIRTGDARDASLPAQAREVRAWLMRIHEAASQHNFQGTFVVSGGGAVSSAHIAHYRDGTSQYERSESLDGPTRLVYRQDDLVTTLWPQSKLAVVEQRSLPAQFPALLAAGDDRIAEFYEVRHQGRQRIAGREAGVLQVTPRDALRYGYRLWADQASGLLLRADVIGEHGEVLETSAFSDVAINVKPHADSVLQAMRRLDGYRVLRPTMTPTRLEDEGWAMRRSVPGFRGVSCVRRPMTPSRDAALDPGEAAVRQAPAAVQSIYSDGLTYVSLFIEAVDAKRPQRPVLTAVGPTQTLMLRHGDWWITVVGDVPAATLRGFADGLERTAR